MATRRPVVLNESSNRLETPQTGDETLFDQYVEFANGFTVDSDFGTTWPGSGVPALREPKAYIPMDGVIPSYQEYIGYYAEGVSEMTSYTGGYVTGINTDIKFRANVADPGYTTIRGAKFQVTRQDKTDIANNDGLWMVGAAIRS